MGNAGSKVWLWNEWPDRWGPDCGIDLVAETYDKKLWAIQAKCLAPENTITKSDVDSFVTESTRDVFSYRLLIGTTDILSSNAERLISDPRVRPAIGKVLLSDLDRANLDWPESLEVLRPSQPKPHEPRPYQQIAIEKVLRGFETSDRGQLIMACGTGKTEVGIWIAERLESRRTLVLVPSLSLLGQTLRRWMANANSPPRFLPVCSDDTVRGDEDHFTTHTSDLGFPAKTDPEAIAEFLKRDEPLIVFGTYHSSPVIAEAFARHDLDPFDLAIADEAHRCAGPASGDFATILDEQRIPASKRIFMTATPRYIRDRKEQEEEGEDFKYVSMDDDERFGPEFHRFRFSEAIELGVLSDFRVLITGVDDETYRRYIELRTLVTTDGEKVTDARTLAGQIAVAKAMEKHALRRVITFHGRILRAKRFSKEFPDVVNWMAREGEASDTIWSQHISGKLSSGERDRLLQQFRGLGPGEKGILSNARCLSEGVDVPTLDAIAFIDPKGSTIDIIQAVGRVLRKPTPDSTSVGYIVLPVFIQSGDDSTEKIEASEFKTIARVIDALRGHDDDFADELNNARRELGRTGDVGDSISDKITIDIPVSVGADFVQSLNLRMIERVTASWELWLGLLLEYADHEGHSRVPKDFVSQSGFALGAWVAWRRVLYRRGELTEDRIRQLEAIRGWIWSPHETKFNEKVQCLREFVEREEHSQVPPDFKTESGFALGNWVYARRTDYKKGNCKHRSESAAPFAGRNVQRS